MTVAVSRHRWGYPLPLPLKPPLAVTVAVAVAVGLAVEPVGFDGFFRAYGLYGRIMRMGGVWRALREWAHYACVRGVRGDRGKDPKKRGCAAGWQISPKKECQRKKDQKKFQKFLLFLVDLHLPQGLI